MTAIAAGKIDWQPVQFIYVNLADFFRGFSIHDDGDSGYIYVECPIR